MTVPQIYKILSGVYADKRDAINQNLYLKLQAKVNELEQSVETLASKENLSGQIKDKLSLLREKWQNSSGQFGELSTLVDELFTAKCNVEKVITILRDYENLDTEVEELERILQNDLEILTVYRKLKMLNYVRMRLMERVQAANEEEEIYSPSVSQSLNLKSIDANQQTGSGGLMRHRTVEIKSRFQPLKDVQSRFNDKIFTIVSKAYTLAKEDPKLLVCAMRIMMNEERSYKAQLENNQMEPVRLQKTLTEIVDELETQQYEENVVGKKNSSHQTKVIED